MNHFAEAVRNQRQKLRLSLQHVADKSGVSKSMICKIERDEAQPTIEVAARIALALGKTLAEMLHGLQKVSYFYLPQSEQTVWEDVNHVKRRNITPVVDDLKFEWLQVELPAHTPVKKCLVNPDLNGKKCILIVSGSLELHINNENFILNTGDSFYFDSTLPHHYANRANKPVQFYIVIQR